MGFYIILWLGAVVVASWSGYVLGHTCYANVGRPCQCDFVSERRRLNISYFEQSVINWEAAIVLVSVPISLASYSYSNQLSVPDNNVRSFLMSARSATLLQSSWADIFCRLIVTAGDLHFTYSPCHDFQCNSKGTDVRVWWLILSISQCWNAMTLLTT